MSSELSLYVFHRDQVFVQYIRTPLPPIQFPILKNLLLTGFLTSFQDFCKVLVLPVKSTFVECENILDLIGNIKLAESKQSSLP